jgi:CPA2 family monovalent cation:H+ antiporter-2
MNHLPPMIIDLAVILATAAVSTLLFSRLRQPVVLGYLIAGFAVGPNFKALPSVVDTEGVKVWAEIGVIFLLFSLGLEFSFKKLAKVGKSAFISAFFEIVTVGAIGYLFGRAVGWTALDSIYLGAALSMSSTTIIVRAFGEAGLMGKAFVNLVFGILIVEDLMAILLMVILSAVSEPGPFSGSTLAMMAARLGFFLLIWFLVGIYMVPTILRMVRRWLNDEIMLIVSAGLCLLMVVLATSAGFSAALGAFIMGSILAETEDGERIEHLLSSVKTLFAAVFFVSVGMMIDPSVLRDHFGVVLAITVITVVGKLLGSGFGAILSGRNLRDSVQAGMSLAQIGEFSFIIVALGASLNVISDFLYPIIIAVSAVTTFSTPYLIRYSGAVYSAIEPKLPHRLLEALSQYERAMASNGKEGALKLLWRFYGLSALLNSVVVLGIGLASARFGLPFLLDVFGESAAVRFGACVLTLAACSPFLLAIALKGPSKLSSAEAATLLRLRHLQLGIVLLRLVIGLALIEAIINQFATTKALPLFVLVAAPVLMLVFRKAIEKFYVRVESRFLRNLNARELAEVESLTMLPQLAPWNANLTRLVLSPDSKLAGKTLEESKFRTRTGATIVMIDRGQKRIFAPNRDDRLWPHDELFVIGIEEQLIEARELIKPETKEEGTQNTGESYDLESLLLAEGSPYSGKSIREIGLGEEFGGLIVGIERGSERILNPESSVTLRRGDLIWIFGRRLLIRELKNAP